MSYHSPYFDKYTTASDSPRERVEVEVILLEKTEKSLRLKLDETSPPRWIPRAGIKILSQVKNIAILRMTEKKALDYNLV